MRIGHCVRSLDPADGGLPVIAQRLAAAQSLAGEDTLLLTHDLPSRAATLLASTRVAGIDRVRHRAVPTLHPLAIVPEEKWGRSVSQAIEGIDFLHMHGIWDPMLAGIASAAQRQGVPYAVAPQGMLDPWSLRQRALKKRLALLIRYRTMVERAAFVHALHEEEARFARKTAPRCRTEILRNGISLEEFPLAASDPKADQEDYFEHRFGWPGTRTLLFLGRLHHKKGLDLLAEAFARLLLRRSDARLVVAGPDEGDRSAFERRIRALRLSDKVAVPGPIYGPEKYAALRSAACFTLPSRQEGFSVAVLEALACQTPVVITHACHFPEVEQCGAGYVVGNDPVEHANAFDRILADDDERSRRGRAGRTLVSSKYTWDHIARSAVALYHQYLN
ncbi:MAG: glycosyltransferase [Planctomycetota bacterium]|nr:glycosyltransferase [Planctomycetaceae bacterium]MDQ3329970.1 glycosyltransferase [Planctomycetota bacterium]